MIRWFALDLAGMAVIVLIVRLLSPLLRWHLPQAICQPIPVENGDKPALFPAAAGCPASSLQATFGFVRGI
jgi:hypothetical protein